MNQRLGQAEPLLHAARKAIDEIVALVGQVEQLQHIANDLLSSIAGDLIRHGEEIQKLPDFHAVVNAEIVGHVADAAAHAERITRHTVAIDRAFATRGLEQRGQEADRGAFAGAVGADEAEHFTRVDFRFRPSTAMNSP